MYSLGTPPSKERLLRLGPLALNLGPKSLLELGSPNSLTRFPSGAAPVEGYLIGVECLRTRLNAQEYLGICFLRQRNFVDHVEQLDLSTRLDTSSIDFSDDERLDETAVAIASTDTCLQANFCWATTWALQLLPPPELILDLIARLAGQEAVELDKLVRQLARLFGKDLRTAEGLFWFAVMAGLVPVDLSRTLHRNKPLQRIARRTFLSGNPYLSGAVL